MICCVHKVLICYQDLFVGCVFIKMSRIRRHSSPSLDHYKSPYSSGLLMEDVRVPSRATYDTYEPITTSFSKYNDYVPITRSYSPELVPSTRRYSFDDTVIPSTTRRYVYADDYIPSTTRRYSFSDDYIPTTRRSSTYDDHVPITRQHSTYDDYVPTTHRYDFKPIYPILKRVDAPILRRKVSFQEPLHTTKAEVETIETPVIPIYTDVSAKSIYDEG